VTKTATLLGVLRATVSKVVSAYTNHGKTTSMKRNSGQKLTLRRIVWKNHRTAAAQVTVALNIYLEDPVLFSQKLSDVSFTNPTSMVGLQLLNF
jgi:hypothetical protein